MDKKILVIDDDEKPRTLLTEYLEEYGFQISTFIDHSLHKLNKNSDNDLINEKFITSQNFKYDLHIQPPLNRGGHHLSSITGYVVGRIYGLYDFEERNLIKFSLFKIKF